MYIKVTVKPYSKVDEITERNGRFIISTREPAENGRANAAAQTLLARHLGVLEKELALVRGSDKPSKLFLKRE
jgi:uncharacterized protein YggU (UPF0235/DUF167 family)